MRTTESAVESPGTLGTFGTIENGVTQPIVPAPDKTPEDPPMHLSPPTRLDSSTDAPTTDSASAAAPAGSGAREVIPSSLHVRGDILSDRDLLVEGTVHGDVTVKGHLLTIGPSARVIGALSAGSIVVHGEVRGSLAATDRLEIAPTGVAKGLMHAPRVALADGCVVWGTVNRQPEPRPVSRTEDAPDCPSPRRSRPDLRLCG